MCQEEKACLVMFLVFLLLCSVWGALHAEEQWYLISESELRIIEGLKKSSEAEKLSWLSQARRLSEQAASLNSQLRSQREANQELTRLFSEYESGQSLLMSRKDTQIAALEAENKRRGAVIAKLAAVLGMAVLGAACFVAAKLLR
jgi:uncharacterized membrane protein